MSYRCARFEFFRPALLAVVLAAERRGMIPCEFVEGTRRSGGTRFRTQIEKFSENDPRAAGGNLRDGFCFKKASSRALTYPRHG
jgi:hypothetical protein